MTRAGVIGDHQIATANDLFQPAERQTFVRKVDRRMTHIPLDRIDDRPFLRRRADQDGGTEFIDKAITQLRKIFRTPALGRSVLSSRIEDDQRRLLRSIPAD